MIHLAPPNLSGKEAEYTAEAIANNYIGPSGPFVERFEAMVAKAAGRKWAVATITGTAALHAAASVCGFSKSTIYYSWRAFPAMRNVLDMLGGKGSGASYTDGAGENHDCFIYGPAGLSWPLVADRAPAIAEPPTGATVECYSFAANKIVTCGHGGAVCGDDFQLGASIRYIIHQGRERDGAKFNYRMADINAAIGCAQMERLDELKEAKRRIWRRYADAGIPMMERGASRWMATTTRQLDISRLRELGIEAREECGGTSLPCGTALTIQEQDTVIRCVASLS